MHFAVRRYLLLSILLCLLAACSNQARVSVPKPPAPPESIAPTPLVPPQSTDSSVIEGLASWYGEPHHGRVTASGEIFNMHRLTAAHRTLPFDTIVRVQNKQNGHEIDVRINDRGPYVTKHIIDLSYAAAKALDMVRAGIAPVRLKVVRTATPFPEHIPMVQMGALATQRTLEPSTE